MAYAAVVTNLLAMTFLYCAPLTMTSISAREDNAREAMEV